MWSKENVEFEGEKHKADQRFFGMLRASYKGDKDITRSNRLMVKVRFPSWVSNECEYLGAT